MDDTEVLSPSQLKAKDRPLIIIDNSLIDERGHNLALARTISEAALAIDQPVVIYAHEALNPALLPPGIDLRRVFSLSVYELFARKLLDHDMGIELKMVLTDLAANHPAGGRILFHTADAYIFCALADWLEGLDMRCDQARHWEVHIATPYEPRVMPGFFAKARRFHRALDTLARWRNPSVSLYFWTETERLAEFYRRSYSLKAAVLQLPAPKWVTDPELVRPPRADKLVMLFLGAAREEKGFLHLPALAHEIAARPYLADRVVMRVQRSAPISGMPPKAIEAFEALEKLPFVEIVEGVLELPRYAAEMHGCDIVLLLYNATNYFARGSGIVMETLSSGKRALAMRGTFMERIDHSGMVHFGSEPREWADHVERLTRNLHAARARSAAAGLRFAARYSAGRYVHTLARRALLDRHFTSVHKLAQRADMPILISTQNTQSHREVLFSQPRLASSVEHAPASHRCLPPRKELA